MEVLSGRAGFRARGSASSKWIIGRGGWKLADFRGEEASRGRLVRCAWRGLASFEICHLRHELSAQRLELVFFPLQIRIHVEIATPLHTLGLAVTTMMGTRSSLGEALRHHQPQGVVRVILKPPRETGDDHPTSHWHCIQGQTQPNAGQTSRATSGT